LNAVDCRFKTLSGQTKDFTGRGLNWEGRISFIAILDVGKYIYKSAVKLKEMALLQKIKVSPVFCDH
jgi:hypothetical protein